MIYTSIVVKKHSGNPSNVKAENSYEHSFQSVNFCDSRKSRASLVVLGRAYVIS